MSTQILVCLVSFCHRKVIKMFTIIYTFYKNVLIDVKSIRREVTVAVV